MALKSYHKANILEAGCDEAGRGCLAGPVVAAAVILPKNYKNKMLDDSKKLSESKRKELKEIIEKEALAYAVTFVDHKEIDELNILRASFTAMHRSLDRLKIFPDEILVDGNRFIPYKKIPYHCIVKGDGKYLSIAAASILAKTYRDEFMENLHLKFPNYGWDQNKGYPTKKHREAIKKFGASPFHRNSFKLLPEEQLRIDF
ncbi:MAG: ribonuclease HII [Crocinitomicaceae bacterium]